MRIHIRVAIAVGLFLVGSMYGTHRGIARSLDAPGSDAVAAAPVSSNGAITLGHVIRVSADRPLAQHGEVFIASNPRNAREMIACSQTLSPDYPNSTTGQRDVAYVTHDNGEHWHVAMVSPGPASDPMCAFGRNGKAFFLANMSTGSVYPRSAAGILIYVSSDTYHWKLAQQLQSGNEKLDAANPKAFVDYERFLMNRSPLYNIGFEGDLDLINQHPPEPDVYAAMDATFKRVAFYPNSKSGRSLTPGITTGTFLTNGDVAIVNEFLRGRHRADNTPGNPSNTLYYEEMRVPGGQLVRRTRVLGMYGKGYATQCHPSIAADDSIQSPFRGNIYIAWCDARLGHSSIYISSSRDGGKTWSLPMILDHSATTRFISSSFEPTIAVNDKGVVGVFWYDREHHPDGIGWDIGFRASTDGGFSWIPEKLISGATTSWNANNINSNSLCASVVDGWLIVGLGFHGWATAGGNYSGMTTDAQGAFHPLWVDNHAGGILQLWTTALIVHGKVGASRVQPTRAATMLFPVKNSLPPLHVPTTKTSPMPHEVTKKIAFDTRTIAYDAMTRRVRFTLLVHNISKTYLACPLTFQVGKVNDEMRAKSTPIDPAVTMSKVRGGDSLTWQLPACLGGTLAPNATLTVPITLQLTNIHFSPITKADEYDPTNARRGEQLWLVLWQDLHVFSS